MIGIKPQICWNWQLGR